MILYHPEVAGRSCTDCAAWLYLPDGKRLLRAGKEVPRGKSPTPCGSCPKQSPQREAEHELSAKNHRAVVFYARERAAGGLDSRARDDGLVREIMQIIDTIVRQYEASEQARQASGSLTDALLSMRAAPIAKGVGR